MAPWIQVDYKDYKEIVGVVTLGRDTYDGWVTTYRVSYKPLNSENFLDILDSFNNAEVSCYDSKDCLWSVKQMRKTYQFKLLSSLSSRKYNLFFKDFDSFDLKTSMKEFWIFFVKKVLKLKKFKQCLSYNALVLKSSNKRSTFKKIWDKISYIIRNVISRATTTLFISS